MGIFVLTSYGGSLNRLFLGLISFLIIGCHPQDKSNKSIPAPQDNRSTQEAPKPPQEPSGPFAHLDPKKQVPVRLLKKALGYYTKNLNKISNPDYLVIIDFSQHSSKKRFYLIDMDSGSVESFLTAHGKNTDPDHDGYADHFSNTLNSLMSSQGFYLTAETYYGKYGYSLRLDGLSPTNSLARERAIVIHGADYVDPSRSKMGRSFGCPALEQRYKDEVIDKIKDGALIYAE